MMDKNENRCAVGQLLPKEIIIDFNLQYESQMIFIDQIFDLYEISAEDQEDYHRLFQALRIAHDTLLAENVCHHFGRLQNADYRRYWFEEIIKIAGEFSLSLENISRHPFVSCVIYAIFSKESISLMNGNRGKLAAQAGHAYLHSYWDSDKDEHPWGILYKKSNFAKKVSLFVETTEELILLYDSLNEGFGKTMVTDAGLTVFKEPTTTCIGIGPIPNFLVPDEIKSLKVLI